MKKKTKKYLLFSVIALLAVATLIFTSFFQSGLGLNLAPDVGIVLPDEPGASLSVGLTQATNCPTQYVKVLVGDKIVFYGVGKWNDHAGQTHSILTDCTGSGAGASVNIVDAWKLPVGVCGYDYKWEVAQGLRNIVYYRGGGRVEVKGCVQQGSGDSGVGSLVSTETTVSEPVLVSPGTTNPSSSSGASQASQENIVNVDITTTAREEAGFFEKIWFMILDLNAKFLRLIGVGV